MEHIETLSKIMMASADVVDQVIADSAGDCKTARRLLKEKYRNKICVKLIQARSNLDSTVHVFFKIILRNVLL